MARRVFTIDNVTVSHDDGAHMIAASVLARLAGKAMSPDSRLVCQHHGGLYAPTAPVNLSLYGGQRRFVLREPPAAEGE